MQNRLGIWLASEGKPFNHLTIKALAHREAILRGLPFDRLAQRFKDSAICWFCEHMPWLLNDQVPKVNKQPHEFNPDVAFNVYDDIDSSFDHWGDADDLDSSCTGWIE
jgi:hypothetical protein